MLMCKLMPLTPVSPITSRQRVRDDINHLTNALHKPLLFQQGNFKRNQLPFQTGHQGSLCKEVAKTLSKAKFQREPARKDIRTIHRDCSLLLERNRRTPQEKSKSSSYC